MKEVIAMHGWAGNSNQWSNWINYFQCCHWRWQSAERGYTEINPYMPKWINDLNQIGTRRVAICHSLGLHLIEKQVLYSATHVVLINSFSRFIPSDKKNRSITMALNKMMSAINTPNETTMLQKFQIKSHKPNYINSDSQKSNLCPVSDSGRSRLKKDLKLLINTNSLPIGLNTSSKILVFNSVEDHILANQTKEKLAIDLIEYMDENPTFINLKEEGHTISKLSNIKKMKDWLESEHANKMV